MNLQSRAFKGGEIIPGKYTYDGVNVSPPLSWGALPAGTAAGRYKSGSFKGYGRTYTSKGPNLRFFAGPEHQ
jgi:hypothetical protein